MSSASPSPSGINNFMMTSQRLVKESRHANNSNNRSDFRLVVASTDQSLSQMGLILCPFFEHDNL